MPFPLEEYLAELADPKKRLVTSKLANLSSLIPEERRLFEQTWAMLEAERRRQILGQLVELAEDNFELNFDDVFHCGLHDPDEVVRTKAIEGLWENEDASLIDTLIGLLREDSAEAVRIETAKALGKFALLAEYQKLPRRHADKVTTALLDVIDDLSEGREVRRRAIEAVAPLSLPRVREVILEAYQGNNPEFKASAIYAMGQNCDPAWLPLLLKELKSEGPQFRFEAVMACGQLESEEAVPSLIQLLQDSDAQVQQAAIAALGQIGGDEARAALRQCLQSPDDSSCAAAEEALEELEFNDELFNI
jgi:HEAT repeat protein